MCAFYVARRWLVQVSLGVTSQIQLATSGPGFFD